MCGTPFAVRITSTCRQSSTSPLWLAGAGTVEVATTAENTRTNDRRCITEILLTGQPSSVVPAPKRTGRGRCPLGARSIQSKFGGLENQAALRAFLLHPNEK